MQYRLMQDKNTLLAIAEGGLYVTITKKELSKIPTANITRYIDAKVRQAKAEQKLCQMGEQY